jgi:hypothetical protein
MPEPAPIALKSLLSGYLAQRQYERGAFDEAEYHIQRIRESSAKPRAYYDEQGASQLEALLLLARGRLAETKALFTSILADSSGLRRAEAFYHIGLRAYSNFMIDLIFRRFSAASREPIPVRGREAVHSRVRARATLARPCV